MASAYRPNDTNPASKGYFWFERDFDGYVGRKFLDSNWSLPLGAVSVYIVLLVLCGPVLMKNRPRFQLRSPLIMWNVMLAMFSIMGTLRTAPGVMTKFANHGLVNVVCDNQFFFDPVSGCWGFLFTVSKLVELGDTVFILLRKQPLIFLHWYHHVTVLIYCWLGHTTLSATGHCFGCMNFAVHSVMYSYYALKAAGVKVPTQVAFCITTAQLAQMVVGILANLVVLRQKLAGNVCHVSDTLMNLAFVMYFSYFLLFAKFYYEAYFCRNRSRVYNKDVSLMENHQKKKLT